MQYGEIPHESCKIFYHYRKLQHERIIKSVSRIYRIVKAADDSFEVIVVDNASSDGSAEYVKRKKNIHTILNKTNVGFSRANNQGIKRARENMSYF